MGHGSMESIRARASSARFERREGALPGRCWRSSSRGAGCRWHACAHLIVLAAAAAAGRGRGFLSDRRCGHDAAARARADRHPDRADRIYWSTKSSAPSADHSGGRAEADQRQYRSAAVLRPRILSDRQYRPAGCRHADPAQAEASSDGDVPAAHSRNAGGEVSARSTGYFQAADIVSQVLNFGLPAAIDAQIIGNDLQSDYKIASRLKQRMAMHSGRDGSAHRRAAGLSAFKVDVDRAKALAARRNGTAGRLRTCSPRSAAAV